MRAGLQHACYFAGKDCSQIDDPDCRAGRGQSCDSQPCREGLSCAPDNRCAEACPGDAGSCFCELNDPLCRDSEGAFTSQKYAESAFPGLRLLSVLQGAGTQGIVGSICPFQVHDPTLPDFGFSPALEGAIVERLKGTLKQHLCLDRSLLPDEGGRVACMLVEARDEAQGAKCTAACSTQGRRPATDMNAPAVELASGDSSRGCFCEIEQLTSAADLAACQTEVSEPFENRFGQAVNGWCFVDAMSTPPLGAAALTAACPVDRRRVIRLSGLAQQARGARLYLYCE